jgi:hypothetical protein
MSFGNYSKQAPQTAVTRPCVLRGLRNADGSNPVVHVEFLSRDNKPYWLELLARTQAKAQTASSVASPAELDRKGRDEIAENRETVIKHSARSLENVFRQDGTPATDKDIALFVRSIPDEDFDHLYVFALTAANFRDYQVASDPQAIAEK